MRYRELMSTNVRSSIFRENPRILVFSECIAYEWPRILEDLARNRVPLGVCLEHEHMNKVAFKLTSILRFNDIRELVVLTTDGSPHCVQLHYSAREGLRLIGKEIDVIHYVIEKGELIEIPSDCVKISRHLHKIKRLLELSRERE